jgi:hypothetical protein
MRVRENGPAISSKLEKFVAAETDHEPVAMAPGMAP